MESVADRESVLTQVVATSVSRIQSVVQINIVAGRQTQLRPGAGKRLVVLKLVLASYVARARTAGQPMNAVFLTNVLIRVARDVQQTQTAVPDSIVVRKNSGMS
jgi:copper(I)-binding protein